MNSTRILVLGGGVGGLVASNLLKEKLGIEAKVTLIERKKVFQFPPSYPWLMLGLRKPEQVQKDLGSLKKKGIDVVTDEVTSIDPGVKHVKMAKHYLPYDYLIIALGAEYAPETIPGLSQHAHHIYDLESALLFKDTISNFSGGTIAIGIARTLLCCITLPSHIFVAQKRVTA